MSLYAVCAAKGSPGVTTVATAMALTWDRPTVLADLDTAGGDVAIRYRDESGRPLQAERGLVSLAASLRRRQEGSDLGGHLQQIAGGPQALVGVARAEQVVGLGASWPHVAHVLSTLPDADVIADCGRVLPGSALLPVLSAARAVVVVTGPSVEDLFHLRERLSGLIEQISVREAIGVPVGVAVLTDERDRSSVRDIEHLLRAARIDASVVGQIAYDPKAANRIRYSLESPPVKSMFLRSVAAVGQSLRELAAHRAAQLA